MTIYYSIFWVLLIIVDCLVARKLLILYKKDHDTQKIMFAIGLLMCVPFNSVAIFGLSNSLYLASNIIEWAPLPILLSLLFFLLSERFNLNLARCFRVFILGVLITSSLFFIPYFIESRIVLYSGLIFICVLAILQYKRKPNLDLAALFLAVPAFAVYIAATTYGIIELGLFAGFTSAGFLMIAFEAAKNQGSASILIIKNKLLAAEQNFSKLFSIIPDPAVIVDGKGTFLAITSNVPTLTGYSKEELIGSNFMNSDLITSHSKTVLIKNLAKRMLGFHIPPYEIELKSKDGKKMQFELNAMKIDYQGVPADMVVFRDLTERNKLIRALELEHVRFQTIAETSGDWIWEIDQEDNYTYSNSVVEKILGYSPQEMIGKKYCGSTSDNCNDYVEPLSKQIENRHILNSIKYCKRRDGRVSILESHAVPIFDQSTNVIGFRGVDRDITEKKELETRLVKTERLAAIGELATMVAHDLRNPLQGVSNGLYFIKKNIKDVKDSKISTVVSRMESAIGYSDKILRDLKDYSGDVNLVRVETNPISLVEYALKDMDIPNGIKLINTVSDQQGLYVDIDLMKRVITNFVKNACEAMSQGGTLEICSRLNEDNFELYFKDTGVGIPKHKMEKLWTPFITTKAQGMGLGLPICKRIIEAHGGQIRVDTVEGKGTTFCIQIPVSVNKTQGSFCDYEKIVDIPTKIISEN